ncbi:glycoside hydrolase family 9 protein [Stratiformator vulcanicus]|uniref:Endoglucanase D n=1 Tax=Stratiformator vulcanicus TaxID=2527980 RepID=A0A517QYA6_9PLAN|nr:glycoside hydrolase family 9 protein [Stratiformator vulcanicus]QDT36649.1 Endoglucanase D precursor [Stratiformator vulcanicus]
MYRLTSASVHCILPILLAGVAEHSVFADQAFDGRVETLVSPEASHPDDGPEVVHVGCAAADIIGIEIVAGRVPLASPVPYDEQPNDIVKPIGSQHLLWRNGKPEIGSVGFEVFRKAGNKKFNVGRLNREAGTVWKQEMTGQELDLRAVDELHSYLISIDGGKPFHPLAVYRKSKPGPVAIGSSGATGHHFIYLQLPRALVEGQVYEIQLKGLNTRDDSLKFTHHSGENRSEAVHVSALGFRPDDPFKRAFLSLWAGTGGGRSFDVDRFELLDESGRVVFVGDVQLGIASETTEPFSARRNHTGADVFHLDFSDYMQPGTYRVHVPGVGVSYSFRIGSDSWEKAFKVSMHGFLSHRSGISLGPPFTDYVRPRPMHPDDGFVVFKTDTTIWDGEADVIERSLKKLLGPELDTSRLQRHPHAWGGYMDAGDWDRRSQHLIPSFRHLELYEIFPDEMAELKLALPPAESNNDTPDILDEALWNIDFFRRLQDPDGGVRGGVESTAHPSPGEASWQETLLVGAYRSDPESTYLYAACAAKAARLLTDLTRSAELHDSAIRAWEWGEKNAQAEIRAAKERKARRAGAASKAVMNMKALAAIELFRLTGNEQYHKAVLGMNQSVLGDADVAMSYALIPEQSSDPALRALAIKKIISAADAAIAFSEKNGFNIALSNRYLPMMGFTCIWSAPGGTLPPVLPRAHYLTGGKKYLAATVASCQYSGGANPMNMAYTTGIGPRHPQAPLHIDSRISGQKPPDGITVYGQSDRRAGYEFNQWAHKWYFNRFGSVPSRDWPTAEAYVDLGTLPSMNEYTIHQCFSPTSFTWGYLAARPALDTPNE